MLWRAGCKIRALKQLYRTKLCNMPFCTLPGGSAQHRCLAAGHLRTLGASAGAPALLQHSCLRIPSELQRNAERLIYSFAAVNSQQQGQSEAPVMDPDALRLPKYCAGCGVGLQGEDPNLPGYYRIPKKLFEAALPEVDEADLENSAEGDNTMADANLASQTDQRRSSHEQASASGREERSPEEAALRRFDNIVDDWLEDEKEEKMTVKDLNIAAAEQEPDEARILCARCYSLSHYGQIKSQKAEASLPQFDLGRKVGRKIGLQRLRRAVVLVVVDAADFDGSLPRAALEGLFSNIEGYQAKEDGRQQGRADRDVRLVLAVNKADVLPAQATPRRLEAWIRRRAKQGGMPRPEAVALVSALKGTGVNDLLIRLHKEVGTNGDVWVVGAQNAGKSSLINAMRRAVGQGKKQEELTTAAVPGTTLGLLKVPGLMPPRCNMFDTPGVPHAHQLSSRMDPEEVKMLLPRKKLKPRTFRAAVGQTVFVGGVLRIDVRESPGATLYITVWASDELVCHFGKTEGAEERYTKNLGGLLAPPCRAEHGLGSLQPTHVTVEGTSWRESSTDIAIAGVGWLGIGVQGAGAFDVWTHTGVAITTREAVIPDYAREWERPGFGSKEQQKKVRGKARSK